MPRGPSSSGGFDMEQFLEHCRRVKPPYECPIVVCGRVYKSYAGIQHHMISFDHENPPPNLVTPKSVRKKGSQKRGSSPANTLEPEPPTVPFSHDMKTVEFTLDGKEITLSVYDPIEILSKEEFEASMPPEVDEPQHGDQARTPSIKPPTKTPKTEKKLDKKQQDKGVDVQSYQIDVKKENSGLPKAAFTIIESYNDILKDAPKQTSAYFRYIEKSNEELDAEIEYDADEEDRHWLDLINAKRQEKELKCVTMEAFEMLMDRLEKESFFQAQNSGKDSGPPVDEDAVCCICMDGECQNSNVILFCDMCNLAVHQECYGVPYIPEGQWLCRRCLQSPSRAVDCALCPNRGGAFKQTDDGRWAHVVCAMWIPEVCFANTVFLEPIDSIGNIPPARWKLTCYICKQRGVGACIQCNKVNCYTAFHVTCSQQAGLHMKIDAIRETSINGTSVTVRKSAYCDMHTPADSDARPQLDEIMDAARKAAAKAASRMKMKKARKILAEKRSATPIVSVPTIPAERQNSCIIALNARIPTFCGALNSLPTPAWENIKQLADLVEIDKRAYFMHRLLAYWTLKRQSRNGVPLLRRLTISSKNRKKKEEEEEDDEKSQSEKEEKDENGDVIVSGEGIKKIQEKKEEIAEVENDEGEDKEAVNDENATVLSDAERLRSEIKYWQRLRQDLERARLLCELIRKREKTKREHVKVCAEEKEIQLAPFVHLLIQTLDKIQEKDVGQIFAEPVDFEEEKENVPENREMKKAIWKEDLKAREEKKQKLKEENYIKATNDGEKDSMGRLKYKKKGPIWDKFILLPKDPKFVYNRVSCKICNKKVSGSVPIMKVHLKACRLSRYKKHDGSDTSISKNMESSQTEESCEDETIGSPVVKLARQYSDKILSEIATVEAGRNRFRPMSEEEICAIETKFKKELGGKSPSAEMKQPVITSVDMKQGPVISQKVHDYLDVVKHPMDLSTMRQKVQAHQYPNVDAFSADFELMIDNCQKYNKKDTIFYRAAIKLRDQGGAIMRGLRRTVENVGFDLETGLMLGHRPKAIPELSDMKITKEIDAALDENPDESQSLEEREKYLLDLLDKANMLRHHIARIKRVKLIRREIGVVRRKLTAKEGKEIHIGATIFTDTEEDSEKEDSDVDDSSVIDDEAEPGEPVRPCSPPRLGASLAANHLTTTPATPSTRSPSLPAIPSTRPSLPATPSTRPSLPATPSTRPSLPATPSRPSLPATPSTANNHPLMSANPTTPLRTTHSGRGRGRKNQLAKVDPKQKRIDSFFNHRGRTSKENNSPKDNNSTKENNSPPSSTIPTDVKELSDKEPEESPNNNSIIDVLSPPGWKRQVSYRKNGASAGKFDVYYYSPKGKKLRSLLMVNSYCQSEELNLEMSEFNFKKDNASIAKKVEVKTPSPKKVKVNAASPKRVEVDTSASRKDVDTPTTKKAEVVTPVSRRAEGSSPECRTDSDKRRKPGRPPKRNRTPSGPSISPPAKKLEVGLDECVASATGDEGGAEEGGAEGDEGGTEESGTSVPNSPSAGVNRRTSVLFTRKADALFKKPDNSSSPQKHKHRHRKFDGPECDGESDTEDDGKKVSKSARKKKHSLTPTMTNKGSLMTFPDGISILELSDTIVPPAKDSFKKYREGGEIPPETDEDTASESNSGLTDTEDDTGSDSDSDEGGTDSDSSAEGGQSESSLKSSHQGEVIPLEPLDLVWAKCRGYPWYPALIINPKMPKTGYFHNGVPIPVPPDDVLALALNVNFSPTYLVLFFDNKRTWQWLPRNKLEPLGVDSTLDKAKLVESRKPAERKAVKKAYEKAILHRYRVTGENAGLSGESENEGNN